MDLPPGVSPSALIEAGNWVSARLAGLTLQQAAQKLESEISQRRAAIDRAAQHIIAQGLAAWSEDGDKRPVLIVRGQAHLLDQGPVSDLERIRQLLDAHEATHDLLPLLDSARGGERKRPPEGPSG